MSNSNEEKRTSGAELFGDAAELVVDVLTSAGSMAVDCAGGACEAAGEIGVGAAEIVGGLIGAIFEAM